MYDIIIIGAGPAGLTSAIYARRANKKVLVLESKSYGGQIVNTLDIENYPACPNISGYDFATNLYEQAIDLGAEIKIEKVVSFSSLDKHFIVNTTSDRYTSLVIILATGTENKKLGLDNEDELIGKGISYCATCDGNFYKGKDVAVIGGGNTALEDALYLSSICKTVYLVHRRDEFRGYDSLVSEIKRKDNIKIIYNSSVTKINASDKIDSISINRDGKTEKINVAGVFVAIGRKPNITQITNLIEHSEDGYIMAREDCHTNVAGIFVAGDVRTKEVRQLVTATSDGAVAAMEAIKYLHKC